MAKQLTLDRNDLEPIKNQGALATFFAIIF